MTARIAALGICALVFLTGGCGSRPSMPPDARTDDGRLIDSSLVVAPDPAVVAMGATEFTVRYRSAGADLSGAVFVPAGQRPPGGWPVVSFGHGTTGLVANCAPSRRPSLFGFLNVVVPLLQRGFVVAATDFQPGRYLDPDVAARNMIDAVRAARQLVPGASDRWAALGESQGGQASWAAAEYAASYGAGLRFVGAANLSPAADLSDLVPDNPTVRLTLAQQMFLPLLFVAVQVRHPEVDTARYLRGVLADNRDVLTSCVDHHVDKKAAIAEKLTPADGLPPTDADARALRDWLREMALPQRKAGGPMLVMVGGQDQLILPGWTRAAVRRACALGDVIEFRENLGEGHAAVADIAPAVAWVADRFAGVTPTDDCA